MVVGRASAHGLPGAELSGIFCTPCRAWASASDHRREKEAATDGSADPVPAAQAPGKAEYGDCLFSFSSEEMPGITGEEDRKTHEGLPGRILCHGTRGIQEGGPA